MTLVVTPVLIIALIVLLPCTQLQETDHIIIVEELRRLNVVSRPLTISGFSGGGSMAIQMQVAFSKSFDGAAVYSATWYRCGAFGLLFYRTFCSSGLYNFVNGLKQARQYANQGLIDPLENLRHQKFYHWIGLHDELATTAARSQSAQFYTAVGMPSQNIHMEYSQLGHHFMPTANENDRSCTDRLALHLVLDHFTDLVGVAYCDYDGAFEGLNFLFNNTLTRPNRKEPLIPLEPLRKFNQITFLVSSSDWDDEPILDPIGFYYIPSKCRPNGRRFNKPCHFHISLHGCYGARSRVGDEFVRQSGFLEVAEVNNIIMMFPQSTPFTRNNKGCWDYMALTGDDYATKDGVQMIALARIIERATGRRLL